MVCDNIVGSDRSLVPVRYEVIGWSQGPAERIAAAPCYPADIKICRAVPGYQLVRRVEGVTHRYRLLAPRPFHFMKEESG